MSAEKTKKPFYKKWWFITICVIVVLGIFGSFSSDKEGESSRPPIPTKSDKEGESSRPPIPTKILLGEVKLLSDGYKVECAFMKDFGYTVAEGRLKVEVFNWELSDNVDFSDPETYNLGQRVAEGEFDIKPSEFDESGIAKKIKKKINTDVRPSKTYLSARFSFTPTGSSKTIVGGSSYQTIIK